MLILFIVGAITKKVKISAKLINTWFGGKEPAPKACLVKAKTIAIRTNAVVIIKILGAKVKIVNQIRDRKSVGRERVC